MTRAQRATNRLALTTIATCRAQARAREFELLRVLVAILAISRVLQIKDMDFQVSWLRSISSKVGLTLAGAAFICRRTRTTNAIATHVITRLLKPRMINHEVIRTWPSISNGDGVRWSRLASYFAAIACSTSSAVCGKAADRLISLLFLSTKKTSSIRTPNFSSGM